MAGFILNSGFCFYKISASLLADSRANLITTKNLGGGGPVVCRMKKEFLINVTSNNIKASKTIYKKFCLCFRFQHTSGIRFRFYQIYLRNKNSAYLLFCRVSGLACDQQISNL